MRKKDKDLNWAEIFSGNPGDEESDYITLISEEDEELLSKTEVPASLPILPLRNSVLFPGVIIPITVGREKSIRLIRDSYKGSKLLGAVAQKDMNVDDPGIDDLYRVGTVAQILKILEMPDGSTSVIIQGKKRFEINELISEEPYLQATVSSLDDILPKKKSDKFQALIGSLKDLSLKIIKLSTNIPPEASFAVKNIESSTFLVNFISSNSDMDIQSKQKLLEINELHSRAGILLEHLSKEVQMLELKKDIQSKVKTEIDQQQREYLLHQQMKTIQDELGGNPMDKEIGEMREKARGKKWSEETAAAFEKELSRLQRLNPASGEYSVQLNYVYLMMELPWGEYTKDRFDLRKAQKILDRDHFGLDTVKERILEHLAVLKLKGDMKSPIICLVGPPGVGKTSLGRSVAEAIGRKYVRMSLGGLHDESEIRGHRKTYVGAMPGRIIQNIKKVKTSNPVFILDEIDKVGRDAHGDPASALLEVLDPEQNTSFHDNYLDLEYDLSRVLFIATANTVNTIHPALRDRMEIINVNGYIAEEKIEIARRHLVPKQLLNNGLDKNSVFFPKNVLEVLVENYTRESGVRELDKKVAKMVRGLAKRKAFGEDFGRKLNLPVVREIMGPPDYSRDFYQGNEFAGVVTGLAVTPAGGEILFVETSLSRGKGNLTITGNIGEVMKESAKIALEYIRAHADYLNIDPGVFEKTNVHIHVPEGAIPKDGPSAGITIIAAMASAFTRRKVKRGVAMTGEITLRGRVLPVGGIKEKILAAKRAKLTHIILSEDNKKDMEKIKDIYLKGLTFHYVRTILDVLDISLLTEKVKWPLAVNIE
ncbi:MAG: endopeptidase La [Bacteroidales bacterium]